MSTDRYKRDELVRVIERYLTKDLTSFQFDEQIFDISHDTKDPTIHEIVTTLWFFYDDITDHPVRLDKHGWDVFQRMILLLKSDAQWEIKRRRQWSGAEPVAMILLALFVWMALRWDFATAWFIAAIPMALAAWVIGSWHGRFGPQPTPMQLLMYPFSSFGELRQVRRSVAGFRKCRYPDGGQRLSRRGPILAFLAAGCEGVLMAVLFFLCAPLLLLLESIPTLGEESAIRFPCVVPGVSPGGAGG